MAKAVAAKSGRKLTKKDLKEDKLVQYAYKAEHFFQENRNRVVGTIGVVIVLILGGLFLQRTMSESRYEESFDLTLAKMAYGQQKLPEAKAGFENVLGKYSGEVAAEAKLYLSRISFDQGNFAEAEAGFKDYLQNYDGDRFTDCAAEAGLAASQEALGNPAEAAASYEAIAKKYSSLPYAPDALSEAARIYLSLNQEDDARRVLQSLIDRYPESTLVSKARQDLDRLK